MQKYEMLERGQTNIKVTTNSPGNTLVIYKLAEDVNGKIVLTNITEASPVITSIAHGLFSQYLLNAPNENCYLLCLLNQIPRFFRVGTPTLRAFVYNGLPGATIPYRLLDFTGNILQNSNLTEVGNGIYCMKPDNVGDYILDIQNMKPIPIHTPYVVDMAGMTGKIVFQKDTWALLALPKSNTKIGDIVTAIEKKYSVKGNSIFKIFSAYPATSLEEGEMLDFIPGITPTTSKYNFPLVIKDIDTGVEIVGFWCKTLNYQLKDSNGNKIPDLVEYEWYA